VIQFGCCFVRCAGQGITVMGDFEYRDHACGDSGFLTPNWIGLGIIGYFKSPLLLGLTR
jgi:hypothetical protein